MTTGQTAGGNSQSVPSLHRVGGAPTQSYKTYSSAAHEPDVNLSLPTARLQSANLAFGERPFIRAVNAVLVILFWIGFMLLGAGSILAAFFILLFVKT